MGYKHISYRTTCCSRHQECSILTQIVKELRSFVLSLQQFAAILQHSMPKGLTAVLLLLLHISLYLTSYGMLQHSCVLQCANTMLCVAHLGNLCPIDTPYIKDAWPKEYYNPKQFMTKSREIT